MKSIVVFYNSELNLDISFSGVGNRCPGSIFPGQNPIVPFRGTEAEHSDIKRSWSKCFNSCMLRVAAQPAAEDMQIILNSF